MINIIILPGCEKWQRSMGENRIDHFPTSHGPPPTSQEQQVQASLTTVGPTLAVSKPSCTVVTKVKVQRGRHDIQRYVHSYTPPSMGHRAWGMGHTMG